MGKWKTPGRGKGYQEIPGITRETKTVTYIPHAQVSPTAACFWSILDCAKLCAFLQPYVAGTGDTKKFKKNVLVKAADHLNDRIIQGGLKKLEGVRSKIADLLTIFVAVKYLKSEPSGLHWDDERGANITTADEDQDALKLQLEKAKGDHRYSAVTGVAGPNHAPPAPTGASPATSIPIDPVLLNAGSGQATQSTPGPSNTSLSTPRPHSPDWDAAAMERDMASPSPAPSPPPALPVVAAPSDTGSTLPTPSSSAPVATPSTPAPKPVSKKCSSDGLESNSVKRMRVTPGEGLQMIGNAVGEFSQFFNTTMTRMLPKMEPSPMRRQKAMELADEKESSWLSTRHQLQLGSLLESTVKADSYVHWAGRGTPKRKAWVVNALDLKDWEVDFQIDD
ncbi:hypothetical protein VNI00_015148 [Paramarasmius palmivorus]|uniref:Uncharacterized protein n=1 Tax=Paramarasmius palmivorus TaxID=297713 RepID=A0AAW0BME2_9AGAR